MLVTLTTFQAGQWPGVVIAVALAVLDPSHSAASAESIGLAPVLGHWKPAGSASGRRRRPAWGKHGDVAMTEVMQVLEHHRDAGAVVEDHLADRRAGQRIAHRYDGEGHSDGLPSGAGGIQRRDDEPVDELVGELAG